MKINGVEVNYGNVDDFKTKRLKSFKHQLKLNLRDGKGFAKDEQLLIDLISVEITRQEKIRNANIFALRKKEKLMKWEPTEKWA